MAREASVVVCDLYLSSKRLFVGLEDRQFVGAKHED